MTEGVVQAKFVGNSADAEKAIAALEKKYEQLNNKITETKNRAKTAAQEAKEQAQREAKAAAEAARKKREEERAAQAAIRDERRRTERETRDAERKAVRESQEAARAKQKAEDEARREARYAERQADRAKRDAERAALMAQRDEQRKAEREQAQEQRRTLRDAAEAARAAARAESEAKREARAKEREALREKKAAERDAARSALLQQREIDRAAKQAERDRIRAIKEEERERKRVDREAAKQAKLIAKIHEEQNAAVQRGVDQVKNWATAAISVGAAYQTVSNIVGKMIDQHQKLIDQENQAADRQDARARGFQVQAGLNALGAKKGKESVGKVALANAASLDTTSEIATQLVSSGFTPEAASGKAADIVLKLMAGSNSQNASGKEFAQTASQFLAATGQDKNEKNLEAVAVAVQQAYRGSDLEAGDLTQISGKIESMRGKVTPNEILSSFMVMREKTGKERASTAQQHFYQRLTGAADDPERVDQLTKLGLKPADVDFIGENQQQVLQRLHGGLMKLKPEARAPLMQRLFGIESGGTIEGLITDQGKLPGYEKLLTNREAFYADAATAQGGRDAARRRMEVAKQLQHEGDANDVSLYLDVYQKLARESGAGKLTSAMGRGAADMVRMVSSNPAHAAFLMPTGGGDPEALMRKAVEQAIEMKGGERLVGLQDERLTRYQEEYIARLERKKRGQQRPIAPMPAAPGGGNPGGFREQMEAVGNEIAAAPHFIGPGTPQFNEMAGPAVQGLAGRINHENPGQDVNADQVLQVLRAQQALMVEANNLQRDLIQVAKPMPGKAVKPRVDE